MPLDRAGKKYSPKFNPVWARVNKKVIIFRNTESDSSCNHRRTGAILSPVCCHLEHRSRAQELVAARAIEEAEVIDKSEAACVPSAWPGADNRIRLTD